MCKKSGAKILKGQIRLGVWVEIPNGNASWKWTHWGCVSGKKVANLQESLDDGDGTYDWDKLDGWDELQ